jgi:hypothetical protein
MQASGVGFKSTRNNLPPTVILPSSFEKKMAYYPDLKTRWTRFL